VPSAAFRIKPNEIRTLWFIILCVILVILHKAYWRPYDIIIDFDTSLLTSYWAAT